MSQTYGVFVNDADAQIQLKRLVRTMFGTTPAREPDASDGVCPLASARGEVGASITPTSGQLINN